MYMDHHVIVRIKHVFENIGVNILMLDIDGRVILPEDDPRKFNMPEAFLRNTAEPFVYGGFTLIGTQGTNPVYLCLTGDSKEIGACAKLAANMVEMITQIDLPNAEKSDVLRSVLHGDIKGTELESLAQIHGIQDQTERCVFVLHLNNLDTSVALDILENISEEKAGDMITEMDKYTIALVKTVDDQAEYDDMAQIGLAIQNSFYIETSHPIFIGIGDPVEKLTDLQQSYRQAREAIDVGRVYRSADSVYVYRNLLLERFLADVPEDMAKRYATGIFTGQNMRVLNEEMILTINKFFENNLNLSETARQLYIHRNTLVYRLDKVQRMLGLDLRRFDDAVTFKLMMLLDKRPKAERNK